MITIERLKQLLHYDPETGDWRWLVNRAGTAKAGSLAGKQNNNGYRRLCVDGRAYLSSRLAWFYMTGEWPSSCVDHIDHKRDNDAWVNLRMATVSQNMHNRSMNRNNTSGVKGVCWHKRQGKWYAQIMRAGKTYSIGLFDNIEDAKIAVETARASLHKEFACSGGKSDQVAR